MVPVPGRLYTFTCQNISFRGGAMVLDFHPKMFQNHDAGFPTRV